VDLEELETATLTTNDPLLAIIAYVLRRESNIDDE
jgi:hypothetical protein